MQAVVKSQEDGRARRDFGWRLRLDLLGEARK
jgi:hypothetical protein